MGESKMTDPERSGGGVERTRRATSYGPAASAYSKHRPDFPVEAVRWALAPLSQRQNTPTAAGRPVRLVDLAAGTGKLTAQLARSGSADLSPHLVAVEPDALMRAELSRQLPGVAAIGGRAEAIPLRAASVDALLAGQAAHWFDLHPAMLEISRVLSSGSVVAALWNTYDDRIDWVAGLHAASGPAGMTVISDVVRSDGYGIAAWLKNVGHPFFSPPDIATFPHAQRRTADSLIQTMRTHSELLAMKSTARDAVLADMRGYLASTPQTAVGEFSVPICTFAIRAVRR